MRAKQHQLAPITLEIARRYLSLRLSIVPMTGKRVTMRWTRFQRQRPRQREVERWFREPRPALGVILGPSSNHLACRDWDEAQAYHDWAQEHPELARRLPTVRTPRGFHVYFRVCPQDPLVHKCVYKLQDGELRLRNCICVLPPSLHQTGGQYVWEIEPWHSEFALIPSLEAAGFFGARAPVLAPSQYHATTDYHRCVDLIGPLRPFEGLPGMIDEQHFLERFGSTIPTGPGQREKLLWKFARVLITDPETRDLSIWDLQPLLKLWWRFAEPVVGTKDFDTTLMAFDRCLSRVRVPYPTGDRGKFHLQDALKIAQERGCPEELQSLLQGGELGLVAALCRVLQEFSQPHPFFLGNAPLGKVLGRSRSWAGAVLRFLVKVGAIQSVKPPGPKAATEYAYLLDYARDLGVDYARHPTD